ncbi:hypothetical protein QR680_016246 [Steinernema hermaphroditum]|uniref:Uncharacterized protein n=1 Tax=Steinernema hermaphroditum TaxID=289476 RepID=A0AA39HCQ6_9BILA|nr:hypothetical protein QR680_016246 [Steinernema hermaphroditum]
MVIVRGKKAANFGRFFKLETFYNHDARSTQPSSLPLLVACTANPFTTRRNYATALLAAETDKPRRQTRPSPRTAALRAGYPSLPPKSATPADLLALDALFLPSFHLEKLRSNHLITRRSPISQKRTIEVFQAAFSLAVDSNTPLPATPKLTYLKGYLEGEASIIIAGLETTRQTTQSHSN